MNLGVEHIWLIPLLPLLAAGINSILGKESRRLATILSISTLAISFVLSLVFFGKTLGGHERCVYNFPWFVVGSSSVNLGFVLDPLTAAMLVMVTFVSLLIFIYSTAYMAEDRNYTKFFCFLSFFVSAMLGIVIANSLLLLFISWELVGLASFLLIGFWYHKPEAAAAAKKAFITTRVGDIGFFLGLLWLYSKSGTLLFYDHGNGALEASALAGMTSTFTIGGLAVSTMISLLIFCGAAGKSGQVPLHVWLPDAMEGPTPVSALIHAATMVAAGVFLMARVYPLVDADPANLPGLSGALTVVTWVGATTAVFAALIAVAQSDIKRILAYSTVSQLGYMIMGLGVGGPAVAMFHLITHAFFKALLFLGAGSVIHGCHHEQDIRKMGGLRKLMPITFLTYAIGMMALSGVPLLFSGFWSKEGILHSASQWPLTKGPFLLCLSGAFLTAFYMTQQMAYVFFGSNRLPAEQVSHHKHAVHESPRAMTMPLAILAFFTIALSIIGTPAWPWFETWIEGHHAQMDISKLFSGEMLSLMILSSTVALGGIALGWAFYGRKNLTTAETDDPLFKSAPAPLHALKRRLLVDEFYDATVVRLVSFFSVLFNFFDDTVWGGLVRLVPALAGISSWLSKSFDAIAINLGFDLTCKTLQTGAELGRIAQPVQIQRSLKVIGLTLAILAALFAWTGW